MKKNYLLLLFFISSFANAQWTSDPSVNTLIPNSNPDNRNPTVVSDGAGGAIIVNRVLNSSTNIDIVAHKINASGVVQWQTNGVMICPTTVAGLPSIVTDGAGGAIICWADNRSGSYDIYAQRINTNGTIMWTQNGILIASGAINNATNTTNNMIADGNGGAIIPFRNTVGFSINSKILLQKISSSGALLWPSTGVSVSSNNIAQIVQNITSDGANGAIVTWLDLRDALTGDNKYKSSVQRINSSGIALWGQDGVTIQNVTGVNAQLGIIKVDNNNDVTIIWSDERNGTDNEDVFAQKISSTGVIQWATNGVTVSSDSGRQTLTDFVFDLSGNAYISLRSFPDFYVQKITPQGISQWGNLGIQCNINQTASDYASIIPNNNGGFIVSWCEDDLIPGFIGNNLFVQNFNSSGNRIWNSTAIAASTAPNSQDLHQMISDGNGGAIVVWQDYRNDTVPSNNNIADIYAQNICSNGQLGGTCSLGTNDNLISNFVLSPNPTNSTLNLQVQNGITIDKVVITDISGKKILEQTYNNSQINVESLANGLYIIEAFSEGKNYQTKFIKE